MYYEEGEISCFLYLENRIKKKYTILCDYLKRAESLNQREYIMYYQRKEDYEYFLRLIKYCRNNVKE